MSRGAVDSGGHQQIARPASCLDDARAAVAGLQFNSISQFHMLQSDQITFVSPVALTTALGAKTFGLPELGWAAEVGGRGVGKVVCWWLVYGRGVRGRCDRI